MMRLKTIIATGVAIAGLICISCKKEKIVITGSETMYPMLKILAEDFNIYQNDIIVEIRGGGSKYGLRELVSERTDMAASSLEFDEAIAGQLKAIDDYELIVIAYDGIAVVVHKNNPVERLHLKQVSDIFAGKITNWKAVGGPDLPIMPIIRNDNSGTAAYMKRHILRQFDLGELVFERYKDREYASYAKVAATNREIAELIQKHRNAISYMGMGSADTEGRGKVKKIAFAVHETGPYIMPEPSTVEKRTYQLSRPLMLVYPKKRRDDYSEFISYLKTPRAHKKIYSSGYLDILFNQILMKTLTIEGKRI